MKVFAELEVESAKFEAFVEHMFSHDPQAKLRVYSPTAPLVTSDVGGGQTPPPPPGGGGSTQ